MNRICIFLGTLTAIIMLVGCGTLSEKYVKQHQDIVSTALKQSKQEMLFKDLNIVEQDLYKIIVEEGKEDVSNVESQIEEAKKVISESKQIIDQEKDSITKVSNQLKEIEKLLEKLKEDNYAKKLHQTYLERQNIYEDTLDKYDYLLDLNNELYSSLLKGTDLKIISKMVDNINEVSKELSNLVQKFNEITKEYNKINNSTD